VSRVDIDRPGPTYTVDTLRELQQQRPGAELFFITGADALANILTWQRWEELFALARFVGVSRPGYELSFEALGDRLARLPEGSVTLVEVPALAISSTDCRRRARDGRPIWYLVPDGVVQYIGKHQLYRMERERA
jgi:nicotinate-nucleotide adenylyltransferase